MPKPQVFGDTEFSDFLNEAELREIVERLASEIHKDYTGKTIVLIGVLKGAYAFMADLMRALRMDVEIDFVRLSSYGSGKESSGTIKLLKDLSCDLQGKHVLIVDEIIDTGLTLNFLHDRIRQSNPASLEIAVLLDKHSKRLVDLPVKYVGQTVKDAFLIGYGLDLNERVRNLPQVLAMTAKSF